MTNEIDRVTAIILTIGNLPSIGPDDDIYDAGLSSILALTLLTELEETFNVSIPDDGRFPAARSPRALHGLIQELTS